MAKAGWLQSVAEAVRKKTPGWNWLHSVMEWAVHGAMSHVLAFAIWSGTSVFAILSNFDMSWWSIILLVVGVFGMSVTAVPLLKEIRTASLAEPPSKREKRIFELIQEAETIHGHDDLDTWLHGVKDFVGYSAEQEWLEEFSALATSAAEDAFMDRDLDQQKINKVVNLMKNIVSKNDT